MKRAILLWVTVLMLGQVSSVQAMRYEENSRESTNVEDRRLKGRQVPAYNYCLRRNIRKEQPHRLMVAIAIRCNELARQHVKP